MINILGGSVSAEFFVMVLIALFLIAYFIYKEWPEFKKRVGGSAKAENEAKTVDERLALIEKEQRDIRDMLANDYARLNITEKLTRANTKAISESLEERRIIMEALLACLVGLQEIGADGPTGEAVRMINAYLNRQAHVNQEVMRDASAPNANPSI